MLEHNDIRDVIPHRHPVLLVDRVVDLVPYQRITTLKAISGCEPCYADLPDGAPLTAFAYPRSLLIESFGQSGAILWLHSTGDDAGAPDSPVAGADDAQATLIFAMARGVRFHHPVYPGDVVRHEARVDSLVGPNAFLSGESYVGDTLVATVGEAIAVLRPTTGLAA